MRARMLLLGSIASLLTATALACAMPRAHEAPVITPRSAAADEDETETDADAGDPTDAALLAGAAKVDITPLAGVPLGGHSIEGGTGYAVWTRLWARAIYVEDQQGEPLVLVVADLWGIPAGLADDVVERLHQQHGLHQLGRAQVLISATHTHHSPANFSSNLLYSRAVGPKMGFDPELRDFLARRIADAIATAANARRPARLRLESAAIPLVARNRSVPPFLQNPEAAAVLAANAELPTCPDYPREVAEVDPCQAVDPTLTTLRIEDLDGRALAVAAFFAAHPTAMVNLTDAYNGDFFAIASARAEAELAAAAERAGAPTIGDPVVALFNGPQGDVSPNWGPQGRASTLELGARLGAAIVATAHLDGAPAPACSGRLIDGAIESGFVRQPLADQPVTGPSSPPGARTAARPLAGKALFAGAEDGPTRYRERSPEGQTVKRHRRAGQGPKKPAVPPALFSLVFPRSAIPQAVPLSVHRIGPLTIAGLPGEFTTVMGMRIRQAIAPSDAPGSPRPLLIGLAGEYMSYFVTPQEYALQHYEGGSTMWGQYAGSLIAERLGALAASVIVGDESVPSESAGFEAPDRPGQRRSFALAPGARANKGLRELGERLHAQLGIESPIEQLPRLEIETEAPRWSTLTWPEIVIEQRDPQGAWQPLRRDGRLVDHRSEEFVMFPLQVGRDRWRWALWWLGPAPADAELRLRATGPDGSEHCSAAFTAPAIASPTPVACAAHYQPTVAAEDGLGVVPARAIP